MNAPEWERARYKAYQEAYWDQTQGDAFRFDFSVLAREIDARVPPSTFTDPNPKYANRLVDQPLKWTCPFCPLVAFTGRDSRRRHLRKHLDNGKKAA